MSEKSGATYADLERLDELCGKGSAQHMKEVRRRTFARDYEIMMEYKLELERQGKKS